MSVRWVTLWVRPPLCVSFCWILACCLLRFAAFFNLEASLSNIWLGWFGLLVQITLITIMDLMVITVVIVIKAAIFLISNV